MLAIDVFRDPAHMRPVFHRWRLNNRRQCLRPGWRSAVKLFTKDEARWIATATNRSAKAKAAELRSAAKAKLDPKIAPKTCALQVFDFDFFFFFFAMTLSTLPLPQKEQWLQRHECDMNGLWRIGSSSGQATHQRRRRGGSRPIDARAGV